MSSHRTRDLAPTSQSLRRLTFYPNAVPFVAMAPLTALALTQIQMHLSSISLFDGLPIMEIDGLPASASRRR
jgi:hypothetical protein